MNFVTDILPLDKSLVNMYIYIMSKNIGKKETKTENLIFFIAAKN